MTARPMTKAPNMGPTGALREGLIMPAVSNSSPPHPALENPQKALTKEPRTAYHHSRHTAAMAHVGPPKVNTSKHLGFFARTEGPCNGKSCLALPHPFTYCSSPVEKLGIATSLKPEGPPG